MLVLLTVNMDARTYFLTCSLLFTILRRLTCSLISASRTSSDMPSSASCSAPSVHTFCGGVGWTLLGPVHSRNSAADINAGSQNPFPQSPTPALTPGGGWFVNGCSKRRAGINEAPFKWMGGVMICRSAATTSGPCTGIETTLLGHVPEVEIRARLKTLWVY